MGSFSFLMVRTMQKRVRELTQLAVDEGLLDTVVSHTRGGHYRIDGFYKGRSVRVFCSVSPSCHHAVSNIRSDIRRAIKSVA